MTRTPLSRLKGQRSRSPGRFTHRGVYTSGSCSGERGKVFTVGTYCYIAVCRRGGRLGGAKRFGAHRGRRGAWAYRGGSIVAAARLQLVKYGLTSVRAVMGRIFLQGRVERGWTCVGRVGMGMRMNLCLRAAAVYGSIRFPFSIACSTFAESTAGNVKQIANQ